MCYTKGSLIDQTYSSLNNSVFYTILLLLSIIKTYLESVMNFRNCDRNSVTDGSGKVRWCVLGMEGNADCIVSN